MIYSVGNLLVTPLARARLHPSSTRRVVSQAGEGYRQSLQNWQSEWVVRFAVPLIFVLVAGGPGIMFSLGPKR